MFLVIQEADHLPNKLAALGEVRKQNIWSVHLLFLAAFGKGFKKGMSRENYPVFNKK